ncbi:Urb2/Npa2 family-domain-containing protein [Phlyctochytrium arcticum]|nr:Urb2/Npa2 family-domain-containing protein [Phlyctochytrium arcticum]
MAPCSQGPLGPKTAESVTRYLRSSEDDLSTKVAFAAEVWGSNNIFIPGKRELLLEWVLLELTPFANSGAKGSAKRAETIIKPHLQIDLWKFAEQVISAFAAQIKASTTHSLAGGHVKGFSHGTAVATTLSVSSRVKMGEVFLAVLKDIIPSDNSSAEILHLCHASLRSLAGHLPSVLHPTLDLWVNLAEGALGVLGKLGMDVPQKVLEIIRELTQTILYHLKRSADQSPNRRKTFATIVSRLLLPLLALIDQMTSEPSELESSPTVAKLLEVTRTIINTTIFHPEHFPEFFNVLHQLSLPGIEHDKIGYPKQLLDRLFASYISPGESSVAIKMTPYVFDLYIEVTNKLSNPPALIKKSQFDFFMVLHIFFSEQLDKALATNKSLSHSPVAETFLAGIAQLLELLQRADVYQITNDETSKRQLEALTQSNRRYVELINILPSSQHASIMGGWRTLLLIDYTIMESVLPEIWSTILSCDEKAAQTQAEMLLSELLRTFTKSRRLDFLLECLFEKFRELHTSRPEQQFSWNLFAKSFLETFKLSIRSLLSAQVIALLRLVKEELQVHFMKKDSPVSPVAVTKKRKTSSKKSSTVKPGLDANFPVYLLSTIIENANITSGQENAFNDILQELHNNFIQPSLFEQSIYGSRLVVPALSLLLSMLNSSSKYWTQCVTTTWVEQIMQVLESSSDPQVSYLRTKVLLSHVDRVASSCVDPRADEGCVRLVQSILKQNQELSLAAGEEDAVWDCRIVTLSVKNLHIAIWFALATHLIAVARLARETELATITSALVATFELPYNATVEDAVLTKQCVSHQLLRSAPFLEIRSIRDALLPLMAKRICAILSPLAQQCGLQKLATCMKADVDPSTLRNLRQGIVEAFEAGTSTHQNLENFKTSVVTLSALLDVLSSLPPAYYRAADKDMVLTILPLLEVLAHKNDSHCSLLTASRSLTYRLMMSREDKIPTLLSSKLPEFYSDTLHDFLSSMDSSSSDEAKATCSVFKDATLGILTLTVRKVIQKRAGALAKDSKAEPQDMIQTICDHALRVCTSKTHPERYIEASAVIGPILEFAETRSSAEKTPEPVDEKLDGIIDAFNKQILAAVLDELEPLRNPQDQMLLQAVKFRTIRHAMRVYPQALKLQRVGSKDYSGHDTAKQLMRMLESVVQFLKYALESAEDPVILEDLVVTCVDLATAVAGMCGDLHLDEDRTFVQSFLELVWFVMQTSRQFEVARHQLDCGAAISTIAQNASAVVFEILLTQHLERLDMEVATLGRSEFKVPDSTERNDHVFVTVQSLFLLTTTQNNEGWTIVRRSLQRIYTRLLLINRTTTSLDAICESLRFLSVLASDKYITMRATDVGSLLNVASASMSSTARIRWALPPPLPSDPDSRQEHPIPAPVIELFDNIFRLLLTILRNRKEVLVDIIPCFTGLLIKLLTCFRSRPTLENMVVRINRSKAAAANDTDSGTKLGSAGEWGLGNTLFNTYAPLPSRCAEDLARLFSGLAQKSTSTSNHPSSSSSLSAPGPATLTSAAANTVKPFSKHAPFLLASIIQIQTSSQPITIASKAVLMEGFYALLDLCSDGGREAVLAGLDQHGGGRPLYKAMVADWDKFHRFKGKT